MTRAAVLQRIESMTDEEFERVEPYVVADLDAADEPRGHDGGDPQTPGPAGHDGGPAGLLEAIERGMESARTEPLIDHDTVMAMGRARLRAS